MFAAELKAIHSPIDLIEVPDPIPQAGEEVVYLQYASINRRDIWIQNGLYAKITLPCILGSDGVGTINKGGRQEYVLINPSVNWGSNPRSQSKEYHILGMPTAGTFAQQVAVPSKQLYLIPPHLTMIEAAAVPLAGLTAYRAVFTRGGLKAGQKVLITGIGGSVALFSMQFCLAAGAAVYVTSGLDEKIEKAKALGAAGGALYTEPNWAKQLLDETGGVDLIIDSAAGEGFTHLIDLCLPGGTIVFFGGTAGKLPSIIPGKVFWKQITIAGSTMGNDSEFERMLRFMAQHQIHPVIDQVMPLKDINKAFQRIQDKLQFGKIVCKKYRNNNSLK